MLEAKDIYKSYPNVEVLKGVSLKITKGEIVSIVGASGAGKSTLLQLLGTLDNPDSGSLFINNENLSKVNGKRLSEFRNNYLGFIFQFHNLLPEFTALENVCIPGYLGKRNPKEVEKKAKYLMNYLGISHREKHKPSEMSGGEQQRTAIARALVNDPLIIFADEPTGNLDSHNAEEMHKLFFQLRKEFNQTFVIVTHNEKLASEADRKLEMVDGKLA
ncbi:MAG TPA: ABC transporter ATP-binding protein [Cytophagaceae bacterium]|jgi:lipoprotein-releasing system ATP-binding protein|nr:ABC transporter ATP-binding protein [Cytophagaceae bacterium]